MMIDQTYLVAMASAGTLSVFMVSMALLRGWQGWLEVRRLEIGRTAAEAEPQPTPATRIEVADLKERVRRLEAIANGN